MINILRREPVLLVSTLLNFAIVLLSAFGLHLTATQTAAVGTISTAVTGIIAVVMVSPVNIASIGTGLTTILVAAAAFGLHLSSGQVAIFVGVVTTILGSMLREKVTPLVGTRPR